MIAKHVFQVSATDRRQVTVRADSNAAARQLAEKRLAERLVKAGEPVPATWALVHVSVESV